MKNLVFIVLMLLAIQQPLFGQNPQNEPSTTPVNIEVEQKDRPHNGGLRAPLRIDIQAFYDSEKGVINICYNGEAEGEVYLYLNGNVVEYSNEINTSFEAQAPGLYEIEVVTDSWTAYGSFEI